MNKDQTKGMGERILYALLFWLGMRAVGAGLITPEMVPYIADAGGIILTAVGAVYAWWINRPTALLNASADNLPKNAQLVITTTDAASGVEKAEAKAMAKAANDKVSAITTA